MSTALTIAYLISAYLGGIATGISIIVLIDVTRRNKKGGDVLELENDL